MDIHNMHNVPRQGRRKIKGKAKEKGGSFFQIVLNDKVLAVAMGSAFSRGRTVSC